MAPILVIHVSSITVMGKMVKVSLAYFHFTIHSKPIESTTYEIEVTNVTARPKPKPVWIRSEQMLSKSFSNAQCRLDLEFHHVSKKGLAEAQKFRTRKQIRLFQ